MKNIINKSSGFYLNFTNVNNLTLAIVSKCDNSTIFFRRDGDELIFITTHVS